MSQTQLQWHNLTRADVELYMRFYALCRRDGKTEFTSDDFRGYNLTKGFKNPQHDIGSLFARWKWNRLIVESGRTRSRIESNHRRGIAVFKFRIGGKEAT